MAATQTIAIIGATGKMGAALAKSLAKSSNRLLLFSRDVVKLQALTDDIKNTYSFADVQSINCPIDATWEADIIILAVPFQQEKEVAKIIKTFANQKIVISISNPLNDAYDRLLTVPGTSAAETLQELLPNSKVVKAFNTNFAGSFTTPLMDGKQADAFIAGNNNDALTTVSNIVTAVGFNPVIAGNLSTSGTLEQMSLLLIQLGIRYNYNQTAGWKVLHHSSNN